MITYFTKTILDSANMIPTFVRFGATNLYFMDLPVTEKNHEINSVLRDLPVNVLHGTSFRVSTVIGAVNSRAKTIFFDTYDFINYIQSHLLPCFNNPATMNLLFAFTFKTTHSSLLPRC